MRFHLFPFRTEKLSSLAPMVLHLLWESRSPPLQGSSKKDDPFLFLLKIVIFALQNILTANNILLERYDFLKGLAMEAYIIENESILKLDDVNFADPRVIDFKIALKEGCFGHLFQVFEHEQRLYEIHFRRGGVNNRGPTMGASIHTDRFRMTIRPRPPDGRSRR